MAAGSHAEGIDGPSVRTRIAAGPVDAGGEGHQLTDVDGFAEDDLVHRQSDCVGPGLAGCAGVGHLVEVLEQQATVDVPREVGHVRGHQDGHRQPMETVRLVIARRVRGEPRCIVMAICAPEGLLSSGPASVGALPAAWDRLTRRTKC
jgi:hypothetical protein